MASPLNSTQDFRLLTLAGIGNRVVGDIIELYRPVNDQLDPGAYKDLKKLLFLVDLSKSDTEIAKLLCSSAYFGHITSEPDTGTNGNPISLDDDNDDGKVININQEATEPLPSMTQRTKRPATKSDDDDIVGPPSKRTKQVTKTTREVPDHTPPAPKDKKANDKLPLMTVPGRPTTRQSRQSTFSFDGGAREAC